MVIHRLVNWFGWMDIRQVCISVLPDLPLVDTDSLVFADSILLGKCVVLIFFTTKCDPCQYEAAEIERYVYAFQKTQLVFISKEPLREILWFAKIYGLSTYQNVLFLQMNREETSFDSLAMPHMFIYGPDGKLRKRFKRETRADSLAKYLE